MLCESIRSASQKEIPKIIDMIRAAANEGAFFSWTISIEEHRRKFQKYAFENPQQEYQLLVCQRNNILIGYIDTTIRRGVGQILGIYVMPNHRRQGIGRTLINHVLKNFKERGCHKAQVKVFADNSPAIDFYFHTHFIQEAFLRQDEGNKDILMMSQFFTVKPTMDNSQKQLTGVREVH